MENTNGKNGGTFSTVRLDINTKIGLMAALLLACGPDYETVEGAVKKAFQIQDCTDAAIKDFKNKSPDFKPQ